jgi:hypothetical protein
MIRLTRQFSRICDSPEYDDRFGHRSDGCALRDNQQAGAVFRCRQTIAKMIQHSSTVLGDEDAVGPGGTVQNFGIAHTVQTGFLGRRKIDGRLTPPDGLDDCELEIVVGPEANAQEPGSPIFALAR